MGVPAFFRWLSRKYPSLVVNCVEQKGKVINGVTVPVDTSTPNPNDVEFDNLYLDMNGIIHPCCHPENKPAPKNEDEMMVLIFEYIDRIFAIVRPRKLLYMAIDGVAPRAKMNQQRSRRFRASKETAEKIEEISKIKSELVSKGYSVPPEKKPEEHFDSNCITPGTPFMFRLAECLRYYIHDRLNHDPGWRNIKVILSDANVPGEGEHKIMDYIRKQRVHADHDPHTHHVLCGADADLIMLGLATHEPYFTIIREEFKPNQPRPCEICGQIGHEMKECLGLPKEKQGEHDEISMPAGSEQEFIFIRLNILREYLERDLFMPNLPFKYEFERVLDDWVFMNFFVGNDFLPHLPSLEIREGAIDRLVKLYKDCVYKTGGYLTDSGVVNLSRVQLIMQALGRVEDEIFKNRRQRDLDFKRRDKEKKRRAKMWKNSDRPAWTPGGGFAPQRIGSTPNPVQNARQEAYQMRMQGQSRTHNTSANQEAAQALKAMLKTDGEESKKADDKAPGKRTSTEAKLDSDEEEEPADDVRLWEDGWKDRYYQTKFDVGKNDVEFRIKVAQNYVRGLCWVLRYYYQGCASWKWYFPYHYAPFASDFINIGDLPNDFEMDTEPFKPLEQLMGVFPAASKKHLPITWQTLMFDPDSPIIDFYPVDFKIDLNGKKYAWQGVALLPFVDEKRLKNALERVYPDITPDEKFRNIRGEDRIFVGKSHPSHAFLEALYEGDAVTEPIELDGKLTQGIRGTVWCDSLAVVTDETVKSPLPQLKDIKDNKAISALYKDPKYERGFLFPAKLLDNVQMPPKTLKPEGMGRNQPYRPQLGFTRDSHYRNPADKDIGSAQRMIRHNVDRFAGQGVYSNAPPPGQYGRGIMGDGPPSLLGQPQSRGQSQSYQRNRDYGGGWGGYGQQNDYRSQGSHGSQGGYSSQGGYGSQGGYSSQGGYGSQGGYVGGGYGDRRGYGNSPQSWQRNMQGQRNAYEQNQQRSSRFDRGSRSGFPPPPYQRRY